MSDVSDSERIEALERELATLRTENKALRQTTERKPFAWRKFWSRIFVLLGIVLIIPAALLIWLNRTITNTDRYVATVAPVIQQPAVQQAITQAASTQIFNAVDIQDEVAKLLPERAQPLAGPISTQVQNYATNTIHTIVASQQFATLWTNVNRRAQVRFMQIAQGSGNPTIDVNRLYGFISEQLAETPLAPLAGRQLPPSIGQIQVANVPALEKIPHFVATLDSLRWIFFGLAVGAMVFALWIAKNRRRAAIEIGIGWIVATLLTVIIVRITRGTLINQITDPVYKNAAVAIWQALLTPFAIQTIVLFLAGAIVATVGWLLGPSRPALAFRAQSTHALGAARMKLFPGLEMSGLVSWLRRHHQAMLWLLLVAAILLVLANIPLTPVSLAWITVAILLALAILEFFVAPAPGHSPVVKQPV